MTSGIRWVSIGKRGLDAFLDEQPPYYLLIRVCHNFNLQVLGEESSRIFN